MIFKLKLYNSHRIFEQLAKTLIKLRVCEGWSEASLVAHTTLLEILCRGSFILLATFWTNDGHFIQMVLFYQVDVRLMHVNAFFEWRGSLLNTCEPTLTLSPRKSYITMYIPTIYFKCTWVYPEGWDRGNWPLSTPGKSQVVTHFLRNKYWYMYGTPLRSNRVHWVRLLLEGGSYRALCEMRWWLNKNIQHVFLCVCFYTSKFKFFIVWKCTYEKHIYRHVNLKFMSFGLLHSHPP